MINIFWISLSCKNENEAYKNWKCIVLSLCLHLKIKFYLCGPQTCTVIQCSNHKKHCVLIFAQRILFLNSKMTVSFSMVIIALY